MARRSLWERAEGTLERLKVHMARVQLAKDDPMGQWLLRVQAVQMLEANTNMDMMLQGLEAMLADMRSLIAREEATCDPAVLAAIKREWIEQVRGGVQQWGPRRRCEDGASCRGATQLNRDTSLRAMPACICSACQACSGRLLPPTASQLSVRASLSHTTHLHPGSAPAPVPLGPRRPPRGPPRPHGSFLECGRHDARSAGGAGRRGPSGTEGGPRAGGQPHGSREVP
ncbi:hypothetical protein ABPG77_011026 [Micractinium sp. CCAP 211/92]